MMAMIKAKYSRKALITFSIIAVLSQLFVSPVLCKSDKQTPFIASFTGSVAYAEQLPPFNDELQRYYLETTGSITSGILSGSVVIKENYLFHLPDGNGLSVGSFTVSTLAGDIYVSFTAKVSDFFFFKGLYRIVGGTRLFAKVRGYGTIEGRAFGPPVGGVDVEGQVEGYIWGLPG